MSTHAIILSAIMLLLVGAFLFLRLFHKTADAGDHHHEHDAADGVCCGKHTNCAKGYDNSNLYFDDEELDRFKGTVQEEYTDEDIEEFRQVLYTMREEEVENWAHCIETRGIELPAEIREEILLMLQ